MNVMDEVKSGSSTLQRRRSVKLLDQQFGYFRLPRGLSRRTRHYRSMAGARHGMCELTHGMAGERHGHGILVYVGIDLKCVATKSFSEGVHPSVAVCYVTKFRCSHAICCRIDRAFRCVSHVRLLLDALYSGSV